MINKKFLFQTRPSAKAPNKEDLTFFGMIQVFGFICVALIFIIILTISILNWPYNPNGESPWIAVIFHFFIPWYAATAVLRKEASSKKYLKGSIFLVFLGIILGGFLLIIALFTLNAWKPVMLSISVELIAVTAAGLGIGKPNNIQ